jgi:hypothetical protein
MAAWLREEDERRRAETLEQLQQRNKTGLTDPAWRKNKSAAGGTLEEQTLGAVRFREKTRPAAARFGRKTRPTLAPSRDN